MSFSDPKQRQHMLQGRLAALKSAKTPKHLKPHLARLQSEGTKTMNSPQGSRKFRAPQPPRSPDANNGSPRNGVPPNQVWSPGTNNFEDPGDQASFETRGTDTTPMGKKVGVKTTPPKPAGSRPTNVKATLPKRTGPGIVQAQSTRIAPPKAPGLAQNLPRVRNARPAAKGLNQTVRPARTTPRAPGIAQQISQQKTRNMRPGPGANPAFYGDFGM